jgi:hypothetical protein
LEKPRKSLFFDVVRRFSRPLFTLTAFFCPSNGVGRAKGRQF